MCTIVLKDIIYSIPNLTESGRILYEKLQTAFSEDQKITIDMADVTSLPSVFLNISIGKFIDQHGIDELKKYVSFSRITRQQAERLTDYLEKYKN